MGYFTLLRLLYFLDEEQTHVRNAERQLGSDKRKTEK